jgi:hypothetical protein
MMISVIPVDFIAGMKCILQTTMVPLICEAVWIETSLRVGPANDEFLSPSLVM